MAKSTQVDQTAVRAAKQISRIEARERRASLLGRSRDALSRAIAAHGLGFLGVLPAWVVSAFDSMSDEIDLQPMMTRLIDQGFELALPVMQGRANPLLFRAYAPGDPLVRDAWGIGTPGEDRPLVEPAVVLVPLLAFDRAGWRLGYGGGYYDRTLSLARARRTIVAVGIALDEMEVDAVPHLDYDQRLDWVITPTGPRRFVP